MNRHIHSAVDIINCTPHAVNIHTDDGRVLTYSPSGINPRVSDVSNLGHVSNSGIKFFNVRYGSVDGIPDPVDDVLYIVSGMVFDALPDRYDLIVPYDFIRNDKGQIIGARGFKYRENLS